MSTLISFHTNSGQAGRCDSRCYNAVGPDCSCVCGGENHQKGFEVAVKNTQTLADQWIDRFSAEKNISKDFFKVQAQRL